MTQLFSDGDSEKFILQIIAASDGIPEDEIVKAYTRFTELAVGGSLIDLWLTGYLTAAWDIDQQDIVFTAVEE